MIKKEPVTTIMTEHVVTLKINDSLEKAEKLFKRHHIRHIPVVSGKSIIGMLSYTDLLRISFADSAFEDEDYVESIVYNMFSIEQVMVKKIISVKPSTSIKEVAEILTKSEFHALPVVENNTLLGIVTSTDLINYLLKQF